jgi:hypothetical protein
MTVSNCRIAHTERPHVVLRFALLSTLLASLRAKYSAKSSFVVFPFFVLFRQWFSSSGQTSAGGVEIAMSRIP